MNTNTDLRNYLLSSIEDALSELSSSGFVGGSTLPGSPMFDRNSLALSTQNHQNSLAILPFLQSLAFNQQCRNDGSLLLAAVLASSEESRQQDLFQLQMANNLQSSSSFSPTQSLASLLGPHQYHHTQAHTQQPKQQAQSSVTQTLKALGSTTRLRSDPYVDVLQMLQPGTSTPTRKIKAAAVNFPEKLYRMLQDLEDEGQSEIASFLGHGRAFAVHDTKRFVQDVMPKYFRQSKWTSFTRQLQLWGFLRCTGGPDAGGFYHELFLKGHPGLCSYMCRVGSSTQSVDRRRRVTQDRAALDPDFYSMAV
jgi:hypothetical protein